MECRSKFTRYNNYSIMLVVYFVSNMFLLLNVNGVYWDDYRLFPEPRTVVVNEFTQYGMPVFGYLHFFFVSIGNGVIAYRAATFFLYFIAGLSLYFTLLNIKALSKQDAFFVTILFLILPLNSARIALIDFSYCICYASFFVAFWLLTIYLKRAPNIFFRGSILLLFMFSFLTNSLLVFYVIPIFYLCYIAFLELSVNSVVFNIKNIVTHYFDFLILPFSFWGLKKILFLPSPGYNEIDYDKVPSIFHLAKSAICKPIADLFFVSQQHPFYLITIVLLIFILLNRHHQHVEKVSKSSVLFGLGVVFVILAIIPYALVGKVPDPGSFESRHMLLEPLGLSLVLYSLLTLLSRIDRVASHAVMVVFLSACILSNLSVQVWYLKDWFYQVALVENYKNNQIIKNNTTFIFQSNIPLANRRPLTIYEHNAILSEVFHDERRFMVSESDLKDVNIDLIKDYCRRRTFFCTSWHESSPVFVNVQTTKTRISEMDFFNLLYLMLTNEKVFQREARTLIKVMTKINSCLYLSALLPAVRA